MRLEWESFGVLGVIWFYTERYMKYEDRVINGARYFRNMKPSDFTSFGVVNLKRWREFQVFLDLILENEPKQLTIEESMEVLNQ